MRWIDCKNEHSPSPRSSVTLWVLPSRVGIDLASTALASGTALWLTLTSKMWSNECVSGLSLDVQDACKLLLTFLEPCCPHHECKVGLAHWKVKIHVGRGHSHSCHASLGHLRSASPRYPPADHRHMNGLS